MSLTALTKSDPKARAALDILLPEKNIRVGKQVLFPPLTHNFQTVGTAFDYLMRFEIERRFPTVVSRPWVAEVVADMIRHVADGKADSIDRGGEDVGMMDRRAARRWISIVGQARSAVASFSQVTSPSRNQLREIATHALRLARIDVYLRAGGFVDDKVGQVEDADVEDCVRLLEAVPWETLRLESPIWLNPTFGEASLRVGGADADVIARDRLIDIKAVSTITPRDDLRQAIGYLILALAAHAADPTFPEPAELVVYYARHAYAWIVPARRFTRRQKFACVCGRFLARADEIRRDSADDVKDSNEAVRVSRGDSTPVPRQGTRVESRQPRPSASKAGTYPATKSPKDGLRESRPEKPGTRRRERHGAAFGGDDHREAPRFDRAERDRFGVRARAASPA